MRVHRMQSGVAAVVVLCLMRFGTCAGSSADEGNAHSNRETSTPHPAPVSPITWEAVDYALTTELRNADLLALAGTLSSRPAPDDVGEIYRRLNVFVRAGFRTPALTMIDALPLTAGDAEPSHYSTIRMFLVEREEWELYRRLLEHFPRLGADDASRMIEHWENTGGEIDTIDRWLAARAADEPERWIPQRVHFRSRHGTAELLIDALENEVRANRTDGLKARLYLKVAHLSTPSRSLDWMGELCRPELALDSYEIGQVLLERNFPGAAISLFEHSLATPLTPEDIHRLMAGQQSMISREDAENSFRESTKTALIEGYDRVGRSGEASHLVEELLSANERRAGRGRPAHIAGHVESESLRAAVAARLLAEEAENSDSAEYWLHRALHETNQGNDAAAVRFFDEALALAPLRGRHYGKTPTGIRTQILSSYQRFLEDSGRIDRMISLLREELAVAHPDTQSAAHAMRGLLHLRRNHSQAGRPDCEQLWDFAAGSTRWEHLKADVLREIVAQTPPADRDEMWRRAGTLAREADSTRCLTLADVMLASDEPARAVSILRVLESRSKGSGPREAIADRLFSCYLRTQHWRAAEAVFPAAHRYGWNGNALADYRRIALIAAQAGARDDAMRIWRRHANFDFSRLWGLKELADAGLGQDLIAFYREMKEKAPDSWVPDHAIAQLEETNADDRQAGSGD